jgi:hypothetical protein
MKRLIVLVLFSFLICGCKKENSEPLTIAQKLAGTWELRIFWYAFGNKTDTLLPGNGHQITFYNNMRFRDGNYSGNYKYYYDSTYSLWGLNGRIEYYLDDNINIWQDLFVNIDDDTLQMEQIEVKYPVYELYVRISK